MRASDPMKLLCKVLSVILLTMGSFHVCGAQLYHKPKVMVGATAGVNFLSVIFIPNVNQDVHLGLDAGGVFRIDVEKFAGIWVEFDYSQRGWKEEPTEEGGYTYERTTQYFTMPIMTHFMVGKGPLKVTIDAGPQFGYFLGDSFKSTFPDEGVSGVETHQHSLPVERKFSWGLTGGPGLEYHFPHMVAGLRTSYYYGLGDFFNNTRKDYFGKSSEQVYAAKLYLLYSF